MVSMNQKKRVGYVISDKMDKTVIVRVDRRVRHRMYGKVLTLRSRFMVHDPDNSVKVGDLVEIQESRPKSKLKRWKVLSVLEAAKDMGSSKILEPVNIDEVMEEVEEVVEAEEESETEEVVEAEVVVDDDPIIFTDEDELDIEATPEEEEEIDFL